jgi:hypothetical protein
VPTATGKKMSGSALRQALAARQSVAYSIIRRSLTGGPCARGAGRHRCHLRCPARTGVFRPGVPFAAVAPG